MVIELLLKPEAEASIVIFPGARVSSLRHAESSKSGCSAPAASPFRKRQSASNEEVLRAGMLVTTDGAGAALLVATTPGSKPANAIATIV